MSDIIKDLEEYLPTDKYEDLIARAVAEIRRLRAENEALRARAIGKSPVPATSSNGPFTPTNLERVSKFVGSYEDLKPWRD